MRRLLAFVTEQRVLFLISAAISLGIGGTVVGVLLLLVELPLVLLLGLFLLLAGLTSLGLFLLGPTLARIGAETAALTRSPQELPAPAVPPSAEPAVVPYSESWEAKSLAVIHEVFTTLEHHEGILFNWGTSLQADFDPSYQGDWPSNRRLIAIESSYNHAYRATERAFQAIGRVENTLEENSTQVALRRQALEAIIKAKQELQYLLNLRMSDESYWRGYEEGQKWQEEARNYPTRLLEPDFNPPHDPDDEDFNRGVEDGIEAAK